jgi:hypothetical protein
MWYKTQRNRVFGWRGLPHRTSPYIGPSALPKNWAHSTEQPASRADLSSSRRVDPAPSLKRVAPSGHRSTQAWQPERCWILLRRARRGSGASCAHHGHGALPCMACLKNSPVPGFADVSLTDLKKVQAL